MTVYVQECLTYRYADYCARRFMKEHPNDVKRFRRSTSIFVVMNNGDEYHFVPSFAYEKWQIGRRGFEEVKQYEG